MAAAQRGLEELIPQMPHFVEHAQALASALTELPGVTVVPDPPQTPLFHVHMEGDRERLRERALALAEERGVWLFNGVQPTGVPGVGKVELNIGEPALEITPEEAADLFAALTGDQQRRPKPGRVPADRGVR